MSLSFGSAVGNLFNRLGKLGALIKQMRSYQNAQLTNLTDVTTGAVAQLNSEPDIQALVGSVYQGILNSATSAGFTAQTVAEAVLNRMVFRDNPQQGQTLDHGNRATNIAEVIRQMKLAGATVLRQSVTGSATSFIGTGNATVVVSTRRAQDGRIAENAFSETFILTCTSDSYSGRATAGRETVSVVAPGRADVLDFNWPQGSGGRTSLTVVNGAASGGGNLLTNSGFENWTGGLPDGWTLEVGTAGTNIAQEATIVYDPAGTYALRITGDAGGTLTRLIQSLDLDALTQDGLCLYMRRDGTAAAAGTLVVELVDEDDVVVQDDDGNLNTLSIDLTTLSTVYAPFSTAFRIPAIPPDGLQLRLRLSTALTDGRSVYVDKMSLKGMTKVYAGGPSLSVHAGSTPLKAGDYATAVITNPRGAGGTLDTWQTLWARLFPNEMITGELLLPSSTTPTISDALIG